MAIFFGISPLIVDEFLSDCSTDQTVIFQIAVRRLRNRSNSRVSNHCSGGTGFPSSAAAIYLLRAAGVNFKFGCIEESLLWMQDAQHLSCSLDLYFPERDFQMGHYCYLLGRYCGLAGVPCWSNALTPYCCNLRVRCPLKIFRKKEAPIKKQCTYQASRIMCATVDSSPMTTATNMNRPPVSLFQRFQVDTTARLRPQQNCYYLQPDAFYRRDNNYPISGSEGQCFPFADSTAPLEREYFVKRSVYKR
jgi:hypothetical protein